MLLNQTIHFFNHRMDVCHVMLLEIKDLKSMKLHISLNKDSVKLHGPKHESSDNSGRRFTLRIPFLSFWQKYSQLLKSLRLYLLDLDLYLFI